MRNGNALVGAHQSLGVVLGAVVRVVEVLGLLEHVLGERALIEAGRRNRAHQVEATGVDGLGERERALRAHDVRLVHRLGTGLEVVHGAEVEQVLDLALQLREVAPRHAELRLRKVALDGHDALEALLAPELVQLVELAERLGPHQHVDGAFAALQQGLHQVAADEPGRAGHEIRHGILPEPRPPPDFPWRTGFCGYLRGGRRAGQRGKQPAVA